MDHEAARLIKRAPTINNKTHNCSPFFKGFLATGALFLALTFALQPNIHPPMIGNLGSRLSALTKLQATAPSYRAMCKGTLTASGLCMAFHTAEQSTSGVRTRRGIQMTPRATAEGEKNHLLIVGCGTLGERVGRLWKKQYPNTDVIGETRGTSRHQSFESHGITPRLADAEGTDIQYPFVVFSAPPSSSTDYVASVKKAIDQWDKSGAFVFTSSGGAYAEENGGIVKENSPTKDIEKNPRTKLLLDSEQAVLDAGGTVLRLAGLYTLQRGAHSYWLQRAQVSGVVNKSIDSIPRLRQILDTCFYQSPEGLINLIHYDDAAELVVSALEAKEAARGSIFLGSDDKPVTRQQICEAALSHPSYGSKFQMPTFTAQFGAKGKRYDNSATRETLKWQPKFKSFDEFMSQA